DPAAEAVQKARNFVRDFPADITGQAAEWKKAIFAVDGTAFVEIARREYEEVRKNHLAAVAEQLAALDKDVAPLVAREEFKKALAALETARARHGLVEWAQGVDTRTRDLGAATWKAFQPLRDRAADAKRREAHNEIAAVKEQVAKWGLDRFVIELDLVLAARTDFTNPPTPVEPEPVDATAKAARAAWEKAIEPATTRQYAAALAALKKALGDDAKADLELLRAAAAAEKDARAVLSVWPKGTRVPLELATETGEFEKVNDPFIRPIESGVELLRAGSPTAVEFDDIAARSLAALWLAKPGADRKIAALLCLLEGDAPGARRQLDGQPSDLLPAKYWQRAARLADVRATPAEIAARRLWFAAERENASGKTRAAAVAKYRTLLNDHAASELVRTRRDRVVQRRDTGKEYVFVADDLTGAGTLKLSRHPKAGACWISMADSPAAAGPHNFVEFQFYALPDVAYRCWVYVGGCCQENFAIYCQSTDLTVVDPATKAPLQAEPGAGAVSPVKHSIPFLKAKHEIHGGAKEAKRWEWVALPLPKYTAGGVKAVRLITDQKGFGAAYAVVSASRNGPPVESEMKSWGKTEAAEEPAAAAVDVPAEKDAALAGHWKFDDTAGATSIDASGGDNTAILAGGATGGPGRLGGALILDGKDAHASIPNAPALDRLQEGSYTLAAWFKPASRPSGKSPNDNAAYYGIVMKTGIHEGLKYGADQRFAMDHWLADSTGAAAVSGTAFPPGAWYHVAGVVSRPEGTVRLYVNGRPEGTHMWAPNVAPKSYGNATWKVGAGAPGAAEFRWAAEGAVDDVRLYSRALNAGEIRTLAGGAAAAVMPTVTITSPGPGETYEAGSSLTLEASVVGLEKVTRVDFLLGSTVLGSDTSAPWSASWPKVRSGIYTIVARATLPEKGAPPILSKSLTIRVGDVTLHRAINFGSPQKAMVDGVTFEPGSGAPDLSINGERVERRDVELQPAVDAQQGLLLRSAISYRDGVVATLNKVPNGTYQVYAYVMEDSENTIFDILLEDKVVQSKVASGSAGSWAKLGPWTVDVTDGSLKLAVKGGPANFAGIEVWKVTR
ncbi:MAG TPA: LamG-like jellyroll fold domain-containing protein, partial [Planctomycetota bacterium]